MEIFWIAVAVIVLLTLWGLRNARGDKRRGRRDGGWAFDGGGDSGDSGSDGGGGDGGGGGGD